MEQEISLSNRIREVCSKNFPSLKITALKEIRMLTGLSLMHAKLIVQYEWEVLEHNKGRLAWEETGRRNGWL